MSLQLEQDGLYILPNAIGDMYAVVEARREGDGWQLIENHDVPFGSPEFKERASLPPEQHLSYRVAADGRLIQQTPANITSPHSFSIANLSIIGHLRDGRFVAAPEGL